MEKNHTKYMTMLKHEKKQYKVHENVKTWENEGEPIINQSSLCL